MSGSDIKLSTPESIPFKMFLLDGTEAPGITVTLTLKKAGATSFVAGSAGGGTVTEAASGWYNYLPTAGQLDTLGKTVFRATGAGCETTEFIHEISVDKTGVVGSFATAALPFIGILSTGNLQAATATTARLAASLTFSDDLVNNCTLNIISGLGVGQSRLIEDYVSATDQCVVKTWKVTPDTTSVYILIQTPEESTIPPAVNVTQFGGVAVATGKDLCAGVTIDSGVGPKQLLVTNGLVTVISSSLATDVVTEMEDSIILNAIKDQTDLLPADPAGTADVLNVNVVKVNSTPLIGDGTNIPIHG